MRGWLEFLLTTMSVSLAMIGYVFKVSLPCNILIQLVGFKLVFNETFIAIYGIFTFSASDQAFDLLLIDHRLFDHH